MLRSIAVAPDHFATLSLPWKTFLAPAAARLDAQHETGSHWQKYGRPRRVAEPPVHRPPSARSITHRCRQVRSERLENLHNERSSRPALDNRGTHGETLGVMALLALE